MAEFERDVIRAKDTYPADYKLAWEPEEALIYESPDKGKTVFARPLGGCPTSRKLIKGSDNE